MPRRSLSLGLLASSTLAALLGCSLDGAPSAADPPADPDGSGTRPTNTASHDDAVDAPEDLSWARADQLARGTAALRVLMTDAPIAADNVFVTFCGIYVEPAPASVEPQADGAERPDGIGGGADAGAPETRADYVRAAAEGARPQPDAERRDGREAAPPEGAPRDREHAEREPTDAEREPADAERERAESERDHAGAAVAVDAGAAHSPEPGREAARRGGWHAISDECQTLDLLTLRDGITEAVGITALPLGDYGPIRLLLVEASIVIDGLKHELVVPSGAASGLKIGRGLSLRDGAATTVTVDFDAASSIHFAPGRGYMMAPVIDVIDVSSREPAAREPRADAGRGDERTPTNAAEPEGAAGSSAGPRSADPAQLPRE
jgi:hypothetical protein